MPQPSSRRPVFSVVIPTYNRPHLVERAISSVLSQNFGDFELIVSDDGSSLDYSDVRERFRHDERVRFVKARVNRGAGAARNLGISVARGEYIALLDDDDEFLGSFLEASYRTLTSGGTRGHVCFSGIQWLADGIDVDGATPPKTLEFEPEYPTDIALFETFMSIGTGYGLCVSLECFRAVGDFNEELQTTEDTEMFLRIIDGGFKPRITPGVHVSIHEHEGKRLTGNEMFAINIAEIKLLLTMFDGLFARHPSLKTQLVAHMNYLGGLLEQAALPPQGPSQLRDDQQPVRKQA